MLLVYHALLVLATTTMDTAAPKHAISIRVLPVQPLIEQDASGAQSLNFDFIVRNVTARRLVLKQIRLRIFDDQGSLERSLFLDENGFPSGISTVPNRTLAAHGTLGIFNPFYSFGPELRLATLRYDFLFGSAAPSDTLRDSVVVTPQAYATKTDLIIPLHGRVLVYEGHEFYAHHRRQDLGDPAVMAAGVTTNPVRYAYDLCLVAEDGALYHGDPRIKENWVGYGAPVLAPSAGTVVTVVNDVEEPTFDGHRVVAPKTMPADASPFGLGNYVVIDHGNGEFSIVVHLKPGSITVHTGDAVRQGQQIAALGASDTGNPYFAVLPHVHYHLMTAADFLRADGLPSYFRDFTEIMGSRNVPVARGTLGSGEIVQVP
jgi:hypothetical protein